VGPSDEASYVGRKAGMIYPGTMINSSPLEKEFFGHLDSWAKFRFHCCYLEEKEGNPDFLFQKYQILTYSFGMIQILQKVSSVRQRLLGLAVISIVFTLLLSGII